MIDFFPFSKTVSITTFIAYIVKLFPLAKHLVEIHLFDGFLSLSVHLHVNIKLT